MTTESQRYNCFNRNGRYAILKQAGPKAGSNPTTGLTPLWAHNPFRGNFHHWQVSRLPRVMKHYSPAGRRNHGRPLKRLLDTWDGNGSTSGPTPWQIYDDEVQCIVFESLFKTWIDISLHIFKYARPWPVSGQEQRFALRRFGILIEVLSWFYSHRPAKIPINSLSKKFPKNKIWCFSFFSCVLPVRVVFHFYRVCFLFLSFFIFLVRASCSCRF